MWSKCQVEMFPMLNIDYSTWLYNYYVSGNHKGAGQGISMKIHILTPPQYIILVDFGPQIWITDDKLQMHC